MAYPPLVVYGSASEYRSRFERMYCQAPIITFDGIEVRFRKTDFDHAFYESVARKDDTFSRSRAERIDWIQVALQDPDAERYIGWDRIRKRYDKARRVVIVMGNYVVVIAMTGHHRARFVTAFVADDRGGEGRVSTIEKIRRGPKWA